MCGILGIVDQKPVDVPTFRRALQSIDHRGPDDKGATLLIDKQLRSFALPNSSKEARERLPMLEDDVVATAVFGHVRLSILDLSFGGHQPFVSADGRYVLVFNGEIYNYRELQRDLNLKCQTTCDTEVLLKAFLLLGPACVERFIGMWSFAIYDRVENAVFASRDPFGIKPFYFHYRPEAKRLVFASEIKAVLELVEDVSPNQETLFNYFINGIKDIDNKTFFSDIEQLEPGCNLRLQSSGIHVEKYVTLGSRSSSNPQELKTRFQESLSLHMRSDVEVGVALSGGIDSTVIIASVAHQYRDVRCQNFSGVYPGQGYDPVSHQQVDESPYIDATVKRYNLISHRISPTVEDVKNGLENIIWHDDSPIRVIGVALTSAVYQLAAQHGIKVLLGGQGADETFGGYAYLAEPFLYSMLVQGKWGTLGRELGAIRNGFDASIVSHLARHIGSHTIPTFIRSQMRKRKVLQQDIFNPNFIGQYAKDDFFLKKADDDLGFDDALIQSFRLGLRDYLDYEDKMSMRVGVESRVPFLSLPFVQYGLGIAPEHKIKNGVRKAILRDQFQDWIPKEILDRRDKTGYASPLSYWMKNLTSVIDRYLGKPSPFVSQFFRSGSLERLRKDCTAGKPAETALLWRALSVEIWHDLFFR